MPPQPASVRHHQKTDPTLHNIGCPESEGMYDLLVICFLLFISYYYNSYFIKLFVIGLFLLGSRKSPVVCPSPHTPEQSILCPSPPTTCWKSSLTLIAQSLTSSTKRPKGFIIQGNRELYINLVIFYPIHQPFSSFLRPYLFPT